MLNTKDKSDTFRGLSESEVKLSRERHGTNEIKAQKQVSFMSRFFANLGDPVVKILLCALAVNIIMMFGDADIIETVGIAVSILLATLISTLSEYGSDNAFRKLSESSEGQRCRVRREGEIREVPIGEIVVGDILLLGAGEMIGADGFVLSGSVTVDQSAMTGESAEVTKTYKEGALLDPSDSSALFRGTLVLSGESEMRVERVGDKTFIGGISCELQRDTRESPLKIRLSKLARQISLVGYIAAVLVAAVYLFNCFVLDSGFSVPLIVYKLTHKGYILSKLLHAFTLGLTVVVMAAPEGLPMMIAVVLSSNIKRMVKDHVLVRKPVGIEAAGSMNILFTDKTGTLTEGKLRVSEVICAYGETRDVASLKRYSERIDELYCLSACYNSSSVIGKGDRGERIALGGNSTDRALLMSIKGHRDTGGIYCKDKLAFDSRAKFSAARLSGKRNVTLIKGAPEKLLPYVKWIYTAEGSETFSRSRYERVISEKMGRGERVLLICESEETGLSAISRGEFGRLTLVCAVILGDRLRPEARASVGELEAAGVQVVMITGDSRETAERIARSAGIISDKRGLVLSSDELSHISDERLKEILPSLAVVARALPNDKSRLVRVAQECEMVVGMTGDGINDAPALKRADIGFGMGDGTQVAKDASDIIILDNNLASIVKSVLYGRNIFKSIRKFISLQLIMNFCAVGISMIGPFIGIDSPVTVVQMLWINIIMDTLGGLAFAGEAADLSAMRERPKRRDEPILNRYMIFEIALQSLFTVGIYLLFLTRPEIRSLFRPASDDIYLLTAFFALFIFSSVFNCFGARTDRLSLFAGIEKNAAFILIMSAVLTIQIGFVYLGGGVLRTAPLRLRELCITFSFALAVFPTDFLRKLFWRYVLGRHDGY